MKERTLTNEFNKHIIKFYYIHSFTWIYPYIVSLPQDIRNQRLYRQRRKQEMVRLKVTLKNLSAKRSFFEEQVNYYNQYVKTCLDNQAAKSK